MAASYRPVTDGNDNVIGFDTFDGSGRLVQRFNTEDEAIDKCVALDTPFEDPRKAAAADADADADADATAQDGTPA